MARASAGSSRSSATSENSKKDGGGSMKIAINAIAEPINFLLKELPRGCGMKKLEMLFRKYPYDNMDDMLEKNNLKNPKMDEGSADASFKEFLLKHADKFDFQSLHVSSWPAKKPRQSEAAEDFEPQDPIETPELLIIEKPMGVDKRQVQSYVEKSNQAADPPGQWELPPYWRTNRMTWSPASHTYLVIVKKPENKNIFDALQEKEFHVITEPHQQYDNDGETYDISIPGNKLKLKIKKVRTLYHHLAPPAQKFTQYHVKGASSWSLHEKNLHEVLEAAGFKFTDKNYTGVSGKLTYGPVISCCHFKIEKPHGIADVPPINNPPFIPRGFSAGVTGPPGRQR
jgi:hypothetical protein